MQTMYRKFVIVSKWLTRIFLSVVMNFISVVKYILRAIPPFMKSSGRTSTCATERNDTNKSSNSFQITPYQNENKTEVQNRKCVYVPFKQSMDIVKSGKLHLYFDTLRKKHGPITNLKLNNKNVLVINSTDCSRKLLQDDALSGRPRHFFQEYVLLNKGFSFQDLSVCGKLQKELLRKYLNGIENEENDFLKDIADMIASIKCNGDPNVFQVDFCVRRLLSNMTSRMLTGEALADDDPDKDTLWELINHLYSLLDPSIDFPLRTLPFLRFLPGKYGRLYRAAIKSRDRVSRRYFDSQKTAYKDGHSRSLVDMCLKIQLQEVAEKGSSWLTDEYIKGLVYDTAAAGMSEMMKSIRILILLLCHYQDVQERVYDEIRAVTKQGEHVSLTHRAQMPYTQAVIIEMLRYVSQTPLAIPHKCVKNAIIDGVSIEENAVVIHNIWGIHHDEDVWGDPWVFRPERFLYENGQLLLGDHKFMKSLMPFSVGNRRCPGENFAMSRIFLTLVSMLQQIWFVPSEEEELPSADPRLYTNKYPLSLPEFTCRVVYRNDKTHKQHTGC